MNSKRVTLSMEDGIAHVVLNRPEKHNALDMPMFLAIAEAIEELKNTEHLRVVLVRGRGKSFCSGLDMKAVLKDRKNIIKLLWKWLPGNPNLAQKVSIGWRALPVPVIMVLHGHCWGGGLQIALGGDFRIAAPTTSLSIMEARWGLIPDMGGTPALQKNLPMDQALLMAMTAEEISAADALHRHLITQIDEDPLAAANALATRLAGQSPDTNKILKRFYQDAWCIGQRRMLARETYSQWRILFGGNVLRAMKKGRGPVGKENV